MKYYFLAQLILIKRGVLSRQARITEEKAPSGHHSTRGFKRRP
jgi:hypothetical protein